MSSDEPLQTILVVDDEPTNIQALGNVLKDDYRVQVATSGDGALAMLQAPNRPKPDMILLDIQMPGLDGYEICRRLKADSQTRNIDIIFVTARDAASDEEYGLSLGAVDYITKPFSPAIVRARVDTHMRLRHKSDLLEQQVAELEAQRQARDQALQRSEARRQQIEAIFRAIPDVALTETDLEGTVREASNSAEHMFGYTREQLIGSNIYILHDPSEHAQVQKKIARLQQTGEGYTTECELIRGTGERFRAQLSVAPLRNERGEVVGEIAACIDLSAQFADEQRLRMAQEAAGFGVWDWDLAADQVYWDAACWRMLGYDPAQQGTLAFADWQELVHPEDLERVQPIVESHLAAGSPFTIELRYRCADGGWLWVQGRGQTLRRGADGSPTYMAGTHVDIQQIKEAEQALREHERDLVEVKRIARLGHWILDVDSQELFCSGEVYELFGIDPQAKTLDLETYLDQVLKPDLSQVQSSLEQALSGQSFEVEHRIRLPQGNERILLGRGYTEFDAQGRPRIVRGTTQDVTEQRVLQRELAEREAHYRDLVENQPLMIERFLPDTTVTYANPALGDCLGVEPEALIGQRWLDYLPAEERENIEAHLAGSTPSHPVSQFENSMPGKNGMQLWAMWTCRAFFDEAGELSHFQAVGVDITARRRAEQAEQQLREQLETRQKELEAIFAAARSVSLIKTDLNSVIEEASTGAEVLFGYSREELIGRHVSLLHTAEDIERLADYVERLFKDHEPIRMETELVHQDGSRFPALFTIHPITDLRGELVATLGVSFDISDQKRAERELAEAVKAKTTFLNAVSHDLRSPLNALTGFVDLLAAPDLEEEERQSYVQQCRHASGRLLELIDSLLDLSRLHAGRLELRPTPFDLHAAIESQCTVYRHLAAEHDLEFTCTCGLEAGVPQWVEADATRLGQILSNLLSNAIKYTQDGGIDLRVCTELDDRITFQVRDTGPGIPPEQQAHIFAAFDRAGYQGSRSGHGLGLAIVRELTELFGGELALESTPGVGSTFSVTLPLTPVAAPETERDAAPDMEAASLPLGEETPANTLHVLVADDEQTNVFLAQVLLEQFGCTVTTAKNGTAALEAWRTQRLDALVLDRHMPDLDGVELAERIRTEEQVEGGPRVPIALYTAYARSEVEPVLEGGLFDTFLGKPLDSTELRQWIESLVGR